MSYQVKEIFYTLQGEGANAGRAAIFCRFAGCNLWSGREVDRAGAQCKFCDTDFVGTDGTLGGRYADAQGLAEAIAGQWPSPQPNRFVVFTGGEPLLQLDAALVDAVHAEGFTIAIETNGTLEPPAGVDWVCVSPKAGAPWNLKRGSELKLVWPQPGFDLAELARLPFAHHYLQPMDGADKLLNTATCIEQCLALPTWKLSVQTHKLTGIR